MNARGSILTALVASGLVAGLAVAAAPGRAGAAVAPVITTVAASPRQAGAAAAPVIATVAGGPGRGTATNVSQHALSVATGPGGTVVIGDQFGVVRRFTQATTSEEVTAGLGNLQVVGNSANGGPAGQARLGSVNGVAFDHAGNVVLTDDRARVQVVAKASGTFYGQAMTAGHIYRVAGTTRVGFSGDGGPATAAKLSFPEGVAVDGSGNLVFGDSDRVRVVAETNGTFYGKPMKTGDIYTIAGNGTNGFGGDGGPAASAELNRPLGLTIDGHGNVVIADSDNMRVRVVAAHPGTFYGQPMKTGDIYTIAGDGTGGFAGDGGAATAARLSAPQGVGFDRARNLVIADTLNERVRVVAESAGTFYGQAMTAGDIYTIAGNGADRDSGNGGPAAASLLSDPVGVATDGSGNLVVAGRSETRLIAATSGTFYHKAMVAGDIYLIAGNGVESSGNGGKALDAEMWVPAGMTVSANGTYLIADRQEVRIVPAASGTFFGHAMVAGDIYDVAGNGKKGFSGDGAAASGSRVNFPEGAAFDGAGNAVIADTGNQRLRVVANKTGTFYGQAMTAGDIYTIAGTGTAGFSGDGGPATAAELSAPVDITFDGAGNVVFSDGNNDRIRVVAAKTGTFYGQAMTAGDIYTIAGTGTADFSGDGGPAAAADIWGPSGLASDAAGNLLFADSVNQRVRLIAAKTGTFYGQAMTKGDIYTVAGNGGDGGFSGDGAPATAAELNNPQDVTVDPAGNLVIADVNNNRVRVVAASTGTFYGQAMTAGDIYTVAGTGVLGYSGNGGPATAAKIGQPVAAGTDATGRLLILDGDSNRVRMVSP
jgi:NHL repeat-containing protein